ncbi:MAG: glycosyltransferase [Muribaculaceae bacterium]|nr:glycosyltransferase [Muribaculaceae bacterium]
MDYPYKLSIITVNLNNKEGLQKTIESVINQTHQDFEWIIIDGGSTDGSKELIEKNSEHINYWVSEPDKGIYNAMNKGILRSRGEYLLFLNSGDYLCSENTLLNVIKHLNKESIYLGNYKIGDNEIGYEFINNEYLLFTLLNKGFMHQSSFFKRNLFDKYGLYREDLKVSSDWLFNIKAIIFYNEKVIHLPIPISVFSMGGLSSQNRLRGEDLIKLRKENYNLFLIFKFYAKYRILIYKIINNTFLKKIGFIIGKSIKII